MSRYNKKVGMIEIRKPSDRSALAFAFGACAIALILLTYYKVTWGSFSGFLTAIDVWGEPFADLQRYYYPMGRAVLQGAAPVDGFVYSPLIAVMMAPIALLPRDAAVLLWAVLLMLATGLYLWLFRRLVPARLPIQLGFAALTLSSFPLLHAFKFGQMTLFATVALLGSLVLAGRGQLSVAAGFLVFAAGFKWHPAIFLAPFVAKRDWGFVLRAAIAAAILLLALPVVVLGFARTLHFYDVLRATYMNFDWVLDSYNTQYFPNVVLRIGEVLRVRLHPLDADRWSWILRGLAWCVVAANLTLVCRIQRSRLAYANLWSFQVLFLNVPFLLGTSWPVDLVFLPFVQGLLAWTLLDVNGIPTAAADPAPQNARASGWRRMGLKRAGPVALVTLASMALSNVVVFNLISDRILYGSLGLVFWSDLLALIGSYIVLLPAVRRARV